MLCGMVSQMNRSAHTHLYEVLPLGLGHEWLELGSGEGVDETRLGHDQQQHLGTGQDGELVRLGLKSVVIQRGRGCICRADKRGVRGDSTSRPSPDRQSATHLLHDTRLPLREGDVATGLVLDELDFNLSAFATGLILIIVVIFSTDAIALGHVGVGGAVTGGGLVEVVEGSRGGFLLTDGSNVGHDGE